MLGSRIIMLFLALIVFSATAVSAQSGPTLITVDAGGNVGALSSLALNSHGYPVISYQDVANGNLKLAVCQSVDCSSPIITTVDNSPEVVGPNTSIVLNSADNPRIVYWDNTNDSLKLAVCHDTTCTSSTISVVDANVAGRYANSVRLNSAGNPTMAYYGAGTLRLAVCDDSVCSSATITTIDSTGDCGHFASMVLVNDVPIISYFDQIADDLRLVVCDDALCTSRTVTVVDTSGITGESTSLELNSSGLPVISYFTSSSNQLMLAVCHNLTCTSHTITLVDNAEARATSLELDINGNPIISYIDFLTDTLRLAECNDPTCSAPAISILDSPTLIGDGVSMVRENTYSVVVSYYDGGNGDLKLARNTLDCGSGSATCCFMDAPENVNENDPFTATVTCGGASDVYGFEYDLNIDPASPTLFPQDTAFTPGDIFNGMATMSLINSLDDGYAVSLQAPELPVNGDVTLGSIGFDTDAPGTAILTLDDFILGDITGQEIPDSLAANPDATVIIVDLALASFEGSAQREAGVDLTAAITVEADGDAPDTTGAAGGYFTFSYAEESVATDAELAISAPGHLGCLTPDLGLPDDTHTVLTPITLLAGDVNGDGSIDLTDASIIVSARIGDPIPPGSVPDMNEDGRISILDLIHVGRNYGETVPACQ